jgi:hypothetical protein
LFKAAIGDIPAGTSPKGALTVLRLTYKVGAKAP